MLYNCGHVDFLFLWKSQLKFTQWLLKRILIKLIFVSKYWFFDSHSCICDLTIITDIVIWARPHKVDWELWHFGPSSDTSLRQWWRLPSCPLVIALVPLKCSSRNLLFSWGALYEEENASGAINCPFKMEANRHAVL